MKRFMFFVALLMTFVSCSNLEKFRPEVESIGEEWSKVETMITELAGTIGVSQNALMSSVQEMNIADVVFQKLPQENRDQLQNVQKEAIDVVGEYNEVMMEISEFADDWTSKSEKLEALKAGLDAKKFDGNPAAQISELKNTLDMANNNLSSWSETLEGLNQKGASKIAALESLMESFQ
jgi:flagellar biosynthesis chaperone FliJ